MIFFISDTLALICECHDEHCPDNHDNFTCITSYKCFAHIQLEESYPTQRTKLTYGCAVHEESGGLWQCRSNHKTPHKIPQNILCCDTDMCNNKLNPTIKPETLTKYISEHKKELLAQNKNYANHHSIALVISVTVCAMLLVIVVTYLYLKYRKFSLKRKYDAERQIIIEDGTRPIHSMSEFIETSSGTGSGIPLLSKRTIAQELALQTCVGVGRYGEVWRGKCMGETVAIKIFHTSEEAMWNREARCYQTILLRHENILGFIAADIQGTGTETKYILITEFYEYGSLYDFLQSHSFDFRILFRLAYSAISGIAYIHREICGQKKYNDTHAMGKPAMVHRNIKTKNILVKDNLTCVIGDLGLAIRLDSVTEEMDFSESTRQPTIRYMAPEVLDNIEGLLSFDAYQRADMYAFGLVLWEMMRRLEVQGSVDDYQEPYFEYVSSPSPSVTEMRNVVSRQGRRPTISRNMTACQYSKVVVQTMCECWTASPAARLTALRVKKTLMKYVVVNDSESSGNSESNNTAYTSVGAS